MVVEKRKVSVNKKGLVTYLKGLQISRYGVVSIISTFYGVIAHYILLNIFLLPLYPVHICVYTGGGIISYVLNSKFTFDEKLSTRTAVRYLVMYLMGLIFGLVLLYVLNLILPYSDFVLVLIVIPIRFFITFFLIRTLAFSAKNKT